MNEQQANWAASHDWFVSAWKSGEDWIVSVREITSSPRGKISETHREFSSFQELREWAGH